MVKVVEVVKVVKVVKVKVVMMLKLMAKAVTAARMIPNFGKTYRRQASTMILMYPDI